MVFERKQSDDFEKNQKSNGERMCAVKLINKKKTRPLGEVAWTGEISHQLARTTGGLR